MRRLLTVRYRVFAAFTGLDHNPKIPSPVARQDPPGRLVFFEEWFKNGSEATWLHNARRSLVRTRNRDQRPINGTPTIRPSGFQAEYQVDFRLEKIGV